MKRPRGSNRGRKRGIPVGNLGAEAGLSFPFRSKIPQAWGGWRHVMVTERRTRKDYARCIRDMVDRHYPRATKIRLVQDNLNTHDGASLYETFRPQEARRILDKIEFHYTPKYGSWLNMAESEINIMGRQCLNQRLESQSQSLMAEQVKARIHWSFTLAVARQKLRKLHTSIED